VDLHWFIADLDPAFFLGADPGSQTIPVRLYHKKLNFYMKNMLKIGNGSKDIHTNYEGTKAFLKYRKPGLFVNFGQYPCSWIRIRIHIPNTVPEKNLSWTPDPDPGVKKASDCGLRIRIRDTDKKLAFGHFGLSWVSFLLVFGIIVLLWIILMKRWRGLAVRTDGSDWAAGRQAGRSRT
jgi:hypothetical protein